MKEDNCATRLVLAGCSWGLALMVFAAPPLQAREIRLGELPPRSVTAPVFDERAAVFYEAFDRMAMAYLGGDSSERTLAEFYSRRQYPGSPPFIPHPAPEIFGDDLNCLACHAKGGWTAELQRHTPRTPHPEQTSCRQCHVRIIEPTPFVESTWLSIEPPRLGGSHLPGSPPPMPHSLQMRENCTTCHIGPGAVNPIRVEHASRGNCRQCHAEQTGAEPFSRGH